jgi:hypothetical protein
MAYCLVCFRWRRIKVPMKVEDAVTREASTLAALYRSCEAYPEPLRGDLQTLLLDYTLYVISTMTVIVVRAPLNLTGTHRQ